ncbi:MAG TPA: endonuclease VII domain-containing protein [Streptosporangiaceae bacterium]
MSKGRSPQRGLEPRDCPTCGQRFQPYRESQRTCGHACQREARKRGLLEPMRSIKLTCAICGADFVSSGPRGKYCDACQPEALRLKRQRRNLARLGSAHVRAYNRQKQLERYGVTVEQHDAMLKAQKGLCAICGNPPNPNGIRAASRLHLDHDHVTGRHRDLLCNSCNNGIGRFRDDPALLRAAAEYIERHRAR